MTRDILKRSKIKRFPYVNEPACVHPIQIPYKYPTNTLVLTTALLYDQYTYRYYNVTSIVYDHYTYYYITSIVYVTNSFITI